MPQEQRPPEALTVLAAGDVTVKGRMPWSSNGTFLVSVCFDADEMDAIYKPLRGERPLWDFPSGLFRREAAAYRLSDALGWGIVPETVTRLDGPLGEGSLQRFVPADFEEHYFTLLEHDEYHDELRRIAVFDLLANNADRKSGHCLLGEDGRLWAIDHGVCFSDEPKLRTVIWDFAGERIDPALLDDVARLAAEPPDLSDLLEPEECDALVGRAERVVRSGRFPNPGGSRPYPWPLV
ncbi:MAG TPA: SCO1664 family protein [Acidimicrobiales bacterium]|nr:SCO1664 family protein [Acidimicrobiales bacterium]